MNRHSNGKESTDEALKRKFKLLEREHTPPKSLENDILRRIAEKRKEASDLFYSGSYGMKYFLEED